MNHSLSFLFWSTYHFSYSTLSTPSTLPIGKLPDVVVACVGGGSNAIGIFHPFTNDKTVRLVGCEAGGEGGSGLHSATLTYGKPGVLHGTRTYLLQVSSKKSYDNDNSGDYSNDSSFVNVKMISFFYQFLN